MLQLLLVGIWGNVRFRSGSRLFCREAGYVAGFFPLFVSRGFLFDRSKW